MVVSGWDKKIRCGFFEAEGVCVIRFLFCPGYLGFVLFVRVMVLR